jgi:anti-anti-sigma factor
MLQGPDPHFRLETTDGITIVHLIGPKLTLEVRDPLYRLVDHEGHKALLLNFENVRYFSSAPLGMLIKLRTKVEQAGGRLKLCGLNADLHELFRITNLTQVFEIYDYQQDALREF